MALILSIDDNESTLKSVSAILEKLGHTCLTASNSNEGLNLARNWNPDLILLDIVMPKLDGFDVLEELRLHKHTRHIPVIILSATTKKEHVVRAMNYKVVGYLTKNLNMKIFKEKIDRAMEYRTRYLQNIQSKEELHIETSTQTGKAIIIFRSPLHEPKLHDKVRKIIDRKFLLKTKEDFIVLDLRYIPKLQEEDIPKLQDIIALIPERDIFVVAGRHFTTLLMNGEFEENVNLYITFEDMEFYIFNSTETMM